MTNENILAIRTSIEGLSESINGLNGLITGLATAAGQAEKTAKANKSLTETFSDLVLQTAFVIGPIEKIGSIMVDTTIKTDRMNSMMNAASGSAEKAAKNMQFVSSISNKMGTDIYATADSFSKLTAATNGTVLEGERTQKMFEALSAANTKMGGSTADLTGMMNAFSQMISKGTVSMEELRGQLGERLPGTMAVAAKSMGLTTQALMDQVASGNVLAEDLLPRLAEAINTAYNDGKFDTARANINRLSNEWEVFKQNITNSDWVNMAIKQVSSAIDGINMRFKSASTSQQLLLKESQLQFWNESDALTRTMLTVTGRGVNTTEIKSQIDNLKKIQEEQSKLSPTQTALPPQSAYVTQTKEFLEKHEYDKLTIIKNARAKELKENQEAWARAIKTQEDSGTRILEITEAFNQRELAINKQYDDKQQQELDRLAKPGIRAQKKEEREAEKEQRQYETMMERSRDVMAALQNDYMNITAKTTTDGIKKIDELAAAQIQAEENRVRNAHITGKQLEQAEEQLQKNIKAINEKATADKIELQRKTKDQIVAYEDNLSMDIAKINSDKLKQLKLVHEAELKEIKDRYDKERELAVRSGVNTNNVDTLYNNLLLAKEKKYSEDRMRISGGYWEKLSLKVRDSGLDQANMMDTFTNQMVDATMSSADMIASGFAEMATNSKASWNDMALSIIKSIEMMIAKMMALWAIQQLVGLAGGAIGGETGGLISQSVGMSPFNGSGMWASFGAANGSAFDNGQVQPFADGGIVNRPTYFNMKNGRGLMGEAGPEAIMPLSRDSSGKLGIRTTGERSNSGGISIGSINVSVPADKNPEKQGQLIGSAIQRQIKQLVQLEVKDSIRPGNILNPSKTIGGSTVLT